MAYAVKRKGRFTAYYRQDGKVKSVGTYSTRAKALNAGLLAEEGEFNLTPNNQNTFNTYLAQLAINPDIRVITRKTYMTLLKKYAQPSLGSRRISAITKKDIKALFDNLASQGISPSTISHLKTSLGSLFRLAVDDEAIATNPTHRIRVANPKPDPTYTLEPQDFQAILKNLPTDGSILLARFLIASGCRYGEATELRVKDFNFQSKEVYIKRTVSDVGYKYHTEGKRFLVVPATKNGNKRTVVLSKALLAEIKTFVQTKALSKDELVFSKHLVEKPSKIGSPTTSVGKPYTVGSRRFQHSTTYSYNVGGCRCEACKKAVKEYRNHYRKDKEKGKVESLSKSLSKSESLSKSLSERHLPRDKWRAIWNEAINKSGIGWYPTTHDLRHANATQLLKNGVDVHEVKERLGHQSIVTTERYLHRIRHQQSNAAEVVNDYLE
ncbi:XerC Integrase [uncultured Caudovirales phage]|uniref:Integrase n=1 Tax=uncultured Caudovirales phage TaxID=2100421 RepID=A0A6J5R3D3_9CAUD|nr:XerC Integrase [uncultured Caudovirales phage]CAB4174791.1 XerC Integrase [uncultured Caudovirales phage]CAB4179336.1 XerC Integrase [uncultured Caudovirales phage]CAB4189117.1 XerC Integrase [uncultured Caudovirales phage]CAB4193331.1 XerC Integrase [uncultured Caudovirales phage]